MLGLNSKTLVVGRSFDPPLVTCPWIRTLSLNHWITGSGDPPSLEHVSRNGSPSFATMLELVILGAPGWTVYMMFLCVRVMHEGKTMMRRCEVNAKYEKKSVGSRMGKQREERKALLIVIKCKSYGSHCFTNQLSEKRAFLRWEDRKKGQLTEYRDDVRFALNHYSGACFFDHTDELAVVSIILSWCDH